MAANRSMNAGRAYWTLADVAGFFGLAPRTLAARLPEWSEAGFPAPLPWSRRQKRFSPEAVQAWAARRERACGARPVDLRLAS